MRSQRARQTKTSDASTQKNNSASLLSRSSHSDSSHPLLQLNSVIGNNALGRVLQTKLKVSEPGDVYEQEADGVAEMVMRMPDQTIQPRPTCSFASGSPCGNNFIKDKRIQTKPLINQITPLVQRQVKRGDEEEETIQMKPATGQPQTVSPLLANHINSLEGGGQPLPKSVRDFFEPRFGIDFSSVHVHADERAAESARAVSAQAYTVGRNIVFGAGRYMPESLQGKKLLAHELTHVAQQGIVSLQGSSCLHNTADRPKMQLMSMGTIQRDENKKEESKLPGNEYELFKLEHKGERTSWSIRVVVSKKNPSLFKANLGEKVEVQLPTTKIAMIREAGKKFSLSLEVALAKVSGTAWEPMPGVVAKADLKALEAKLSEGDIDINVFKVGVGIEGELTKAISGNVLGDALMDTKIGTLILQGMKVKIQGRFEIAIDPADVVRLMRMAKMNIEIAENVRQTVEATKKLEQLNGERNRIKQLLKRNLTKGARRKLVKRLARNNKKITELGKKILTNKKMLVVLKNSYTGLAKSLKSKAGRLVGAAIKKVGRKFLLQFVPVINIIMTAIDVYEIVNAIYKLQTGEAEFGIGGDESEDESGKSGEKEGKAEGTGKEGRKEGYAGAEVADAGETSVGKEEADVGDSEESGSSIEEVELGPEIDIEEELKAGAEGPTATTGVAQPLNPNAQKVYDALKSDVAVGQAFKSEDINDLNAIISKDLTDEELQAVLDLIKQQGVPKGDPLDALGTILEYVDQQRASKTMTTIESGGKKEILSEEPSSNQTTQKDDSGATTSEGESKVEGGEGGAEKFREEKAGKAQAVLREIAQIGETKGEDVPVKKFEFDVVRGFDPQKNYKSGDRISLTIRFTFEGQTYEPTFIVIVKDRQVTNDNIILTANNASGWRIKDGNFIMPKGEEIIIDWNLR